MPTPTGSLEELFRHHLGEEAAVPPRPLLWDQIDNSLLIRQNETYRRRLAATRWVAAASLLLATLAGTGWWATGRYGTTGSRADVAATGRPATGTGTPAGTRPAPLSGTGAASRGSYATGAPAAGSATGFGSAAVRHDFETGLASELAIPHRQAAAANAATGSPGNLNSPVRANSPANALATAGPTQTAASQPSPGNAPAARDQAFALPGTAGAAAGGATLAATVAVATPLATATATTTATGAGLGLGSLATAALVPATGAAEAAPVGLLAAHPTTLHLPGATGLPEGLAAVPLPAEPPLMGPDTHRWHYGVSYAAGAFNPNINFSRVGSGHDYSQAPAFGANSAALTEAAATEYRTNLRPGLSQRIALLATRHLGARWSFSTGAELGQATAQSASSMAFVGEQLFDLSQPATGPTRTTSFRYRTAGIPLELRYANPVKRGWSIYGRLGGVVTALLGVRSEAEGYPEATRTYSIASAGTPYRRVLGSLRGGAGTQFRTSNGRWALSVGPVAELGLLSLNAHPAQNFMAQYRPYSFGVEAGVEFGR